MREEIEVYYQQDGKTIGVRAYRLCATRTIRREETSSRGNRPNTRDLADFLSSLRGHGEAVIVIKEESSEYVAKAFVKD